MSDEPTRGYIDDSVNAALDGPQLRPIATIEGLSIVVTPDGDRLVIEVELGGLHAVLPLDLNDVDAITRIGRLYRERMS